MFDLLKNDSVMCEPIKTKREYQYISSYIIINDKSIPEGATYEVMCPNCKMILKRKKINEKNTPVVIYE